MFFNLYLCTSPSPPCYCSFLPLSSCSSGLIHFPSFSTLFLLPTLLSSFSPVHTNAHAHPRWLNWSRSMEPSAGRWSPSTWRVESASSAASAGTTTWTQRSRRHHGLKRRTESSTRHMRNWATAGLKSLSCSLAGELRNEERKVQKREAKWITEPLLVYCAKLRLRGWNGEEDIVGTKKTEKTNERKQCSLHTNWR